MYKVLLTLLRGALGGGGGGTVLRAECFFRLTLSLKRGVNTGGSGFVTLEEFT